MSSAINNPMAMQADIFSSQSTADMTRPLADRMRPKSLDEFFGQGHLLSSDKSLYKAVISGNIHSMILWGPPGCGKTTLARVIAHYASAEFISLSAVFSGVKDIREAMQQAEHFRQSGKATILFIDEVHRFNKSQQDAFLPYVEDGTVIFIGATTENPSFELNNALLSRARVYVLKTLDEDAIRQIIQHAIEDKRGLASANIVVDNTASKLLIDAADGDARRALNLLEVAADLAEMKDGTSYISESAVADVVSGGSTRRFDNKGESFYDQISALHKSVRGSSPDASLYWLARMIDGGCDPLYIARRIVRMASEDIGIADPRALQIALNAWDAQERLGSPEGELALAQAVVYMASVPKSNAVYKAYNAAMRDVKEKGSQEIPLHLRNAPTRLMKELDYGKHYRYAHDEPEAYAAGESYFPESMGDRTYYYPTDRGLEKKVAEWLRHLKDMDKQYNSRQEDSQRG